MIRVVPNTPNPASHSHKLEDLPVLTRIEDVARVSVGAMVIHVEDGSTGAVVNPELQTTAQGIRRIQIDLDGPRHPKRRWVPVDEWRLTYDPASLASIMRYAFDVYGLTHDDLVKLRRHITAAYESQSPDCKERYGRAILADVGLVVLRRLAMGRSVKQILRLSQGKLCKLARQPQLTSPPGPLSTT